MYRNELKECAIGIYINGGEPKIEKNSIANCSDSAVLIASGAKPIINENNIIQHTVAKAIWATSLAAFDIDASGNYWGRTNKEEVERNIFDQRTDASGNKTGFRIIIDPIATEIFKDARPL